MLQKVILPIALFTLLSFYKFAAANYTVYKPVPPDFAFKKVINVPSTANGYDPCRFFQIKGDSMFRMG